MPQQNRFVSRSVVIDAPRREVFELLAQPARHADFDGSGSVKGRLRGPARLDRGSRFGMRMRILVPYTIRNEVVEFEEGSLIGWRHIGHHVWRYQLEDAPLGDGSTGTRVTETFDWSTARSPLAIEKAGLDRRNTTSIEKTLVRLKALAEGKS